MVQIKDSSGGLDEAIEWANHLSGDFSPATIAAAEMALNGAFAQTQTDVHVDTSELRFSGRAVSHREGSIWEGIIRYGGPGIPQAYYEPRRGEDHDYLRNLPAHEKKFADALNKHFEGA